MDAGCAVLCPAVVDAAVVAVGATLYQFPAIQSYPSIHPLFYPGVCHALTEGTSTFTIILFPSLALLVPCHCCHAPTSTVYTPGQRPRGTHASWQGGGGEMPQRVWA